jgi:putative spermidine/putrescine transport system permease protein
MMGPDRIRSFALLLGLPLLFMLVAYAAPLATTLLASFASQQEPGVTLHNYLEIVQSRDYLDILGVTLRIALAVTVVCLAMGYVIAWYIAMMIKSSWARRLAYVIVILPLFTSNVVRSFGFMIILGRKGILNESLMALGVIDTPLRLLYNELSVVIGLSYISLPFVVLALIASLQSINPELLQAASDLGAKPFAAFRTVVFPLTLPGVLGGSVLAFTLCVSAYVTPSVMFGGRGAVMSMLIYEQYMSTMNYGLGAALAVALAVTAIVLLVLQGWVFNKGMRWVRP